MRLDYILGWYQPNTITFHNWEVYSLSEEGNLHFDLLNIRSFTLIPKLEVIIFVIHVQGKLHVEQV